MQRIADIIQHGCYGIASNVYPLPLWEIRFSAFLLSSTRLTLPPPSPFASPPPPAPNLGLSLFFSVIVL